MPGSHRTPRALALGRRVSAPLGRLLAASEPTPYDSPVLLTDVLARWWAGRTGRRRTHVLDDPVFLAPGRSWTRHPTAREEELIITVTGDGRTVPIEVREGVTG